MLNFYKKLLLLLTMGLIFTSVNANAWQSCSTQAKNLAVSTYGGKVYSVTHVGNGNWNVTLVYANGNFSSVTVFPGCK